MSDERVGVFAMDHHLVGDLRVSTIEINLHNEDTFETIVFQGSGALYEWRWDDRDDARLGHDAVLSWLRDGGPSPYEEQKLWP